jgi:hypothetical protein
MGYQNEEILIRGYLHWAASPEGEACRDRFGLSVSPLGSDAAHGMKVRHFLSWVTQEHLESIVELGDRAREAYRAMEAAPVTTGMARSYTISASMRAMAAYMLKLHRAHHEYNDG